MKRIHYKYLSFALFLLTLGSCKKFLEEKPTNFLTPGFTITNTKEAQALVNASYSKLNGLVNGQPSSYGGNTWNLMEFMTGKANSDLGQTGFVNFQTLTYNTTSFYVDTWWQQMYLGIGACNLALEDLSACDRRRRVGLDESQYAGPGACSKGAVLFLPRASVRSRAQSDLCPQGS